MLSVCKSTSIFSLTNSREVVQDEFARELLDLWQTRHLNGTIYTYSLYTMIVGFLLVEKKSDEWIIRGTWVAEWCRGKGVGARMMQDLLSDFSGCSKIHYIFVNITPGAEGFYTKFGFNIWGWRTDLEEEMAVGTYSNVQADLEQTRTAAYFLGRFRSAVSK